MDCGKYPTEKVEIRGAVFKTERVSVECLMSPINNINVGLNVKHEKKRLVTRSHSHSHSQARNVWVQPRPGQAGPASLEAARSNASVGCDHWD